MAIRLGVAHRPRRRLAHLEQSRGCGTMARLVVNRVIVGGTLWPRMGLLSLPRIFSAGAVSPGARVCSPRRRRVVGFLRRNRSHLIRTLFADRVSNEQFRRIGDGTISF